MKHERQDRRSVRTRRLLGTALRELMLKQRYDTITVQQIIDHANVGRSTFYAHFEDKEDLLVSEIERIIHLLGGQIHEDGAALGNRQPIVGSLALFRHIGDNPALHRALVRGHAAELFFTRAQAFLSRIIERNLAELIAGGQGRPPTMPMPVIAAYLAGTLMAMIKWWMESNTPYPAEQMDQMFRRLALPGVWAALGQEQVSLQI